MKKERVNRRKEQAAETRKKLYESAVRLFNQYNFADVSVDSIVEMAGVSKGTFYVHFESKDALIAAIISEHVTDIDLDYKTYLDSLSDMSTPEILLALTGKIADVLADRIGYGTMKTVYTLHLTRAIDTDSLKSYSREIYKMFTEVIDRGIAQGELKAGISADLLARHFIMAIRGLTYEWCIRYPDFDLKEQSLAHIQMLLAGIKRSSPEP